ncbi:interferon lambda receptor 1 isoform 2-T2 [Pholidichthys leucotaenia]
MKMRSVNVLILLLFCYACLSTSNEEGKKVEGKKAYFESKNFSNILRWFPADAASGKKVLYSVKYFTYRKGSEDPRNKENCQNITALSCDLTAETAISRNDDSYIAKVFVNGKIYDKTYIFTPFRDTTLGAPIVSISTSASSLNVNVTLPKGPNGLSIADIIINSTKHLPSKSVIIYRLIPDPKLAAQNEENQNGQFVIKLANPGEYCGHVEYKVYGRVSQNETFCVKMPKIPENPWIHLRWLLVSVIVLGSSVLILAVCACRYVKGRKLKNKPQALMINPVTPKRILDLDDNRLISKDLPHLIWPESTDSSVDTGTCSTIPNPGDTSTQSSSIYGAVVVAGSRPAEQHEHIQQASPQCTSQPLLSPSGKCWNKGKLDPKLTSGVAAPLSNLEHNVNNPDGQLIVHTVQDTNGQLVLPLLNFQLQSSSGDTDSQMSPERKPLLSDLIIFKEGLPSASLESLESGEWSDSGCDDTTLNTPTYPYNNTHYSPSQTTLPDFNHDFQCQSSTCSDATLESGYKENWIPEIFHRPATMETCKNIDYPWSWDGNEITEEDESRGVEKSKQILLKDWAVELQE